jgi:hypothetical protein
VTRTGYAKDHSAVIRALKSRHESAGNALSNLRELRELADYKFEAVFSAEQLATAAGLAGRVDYYCGSWWPT